MKATNRKRFFSRLWTINSESTRSSRAGNHKRSTARGITCPSITYPEEVPHPWLGYPSWSGWGVPHSDLVGGTHSWLGVPHLHLARGYPIPGSRVPHHGVPPPRTGVPPGKGPGTSHWGTPRKDMGPVEALWDGDGYPPC